MIAARLFASRSDRDWQGSPYPLARSHAVVVGVLCARLYKEVQF